MNLNILQTLAADIRQFDEQVKAGTAELRARAGLTDDPDFDAQHDRKAWGPLKDKLAELFF